MEALLTVTALTGLAFLLWFLHQNETKRDFWNTRDELWQRLENLGGDE